MSVKIGDHFMVGDKGIGNIPSYQTLGNFINTVLPNIYILSGLIMVILFIIGGFGIMSSSGDPEKQDKSAKTIKAAVIGFFIVFGSYWLIQIIQFITGVNIFDPGV